MGPNVVQIEADKAEREQQANDEAMADCTRHECVQLRSHSKTLQETVVQLMCKQRDRVLEQSASKSASLNATSLKERMDHLIQRVSGMDLCAPAQYSLNGSEPSVMMQALQDWQRHTSITYFEDSGDDHALRMEALRSPPSSEHDKPRRAGESSWRQSGAKASGTPGSAFSESSRSRLDRRAEKEDLSTIQALEAKRDELQSSLKEYKRRCADLEEQLARKDEALFVAEEALLAAEDAKAEAEKSAAEHQEECRELRQVLADHESRLRVSTRAASAEAKGHARKLANMEKTIVALSSENNALTQDKLELQALLQQEERQTRALMQQSDSLQKALDVLHASGDAGTNLVGMPPAPQNAEQLASILKNLLSAPEVQVSAPRRPPEDISQEGGGGRGAGVALRENSSGASSAGLYGIGVSANHVTYQGPHEANAQRPAYPVSHAQPAYQLASQPALALASYAAPEAVSATDTEPVPASHSAYAAADGGRGAVSSFTMYAELDGGRTRAPLVIASGPEVQTSMSYSAGHSTQGGVTPRQSAFIANSGLDCSFRTALNLTPPQQQCHRDVAAEHDVSIGSDATYMSPLAGDASYLAAEADVSVGHIGGDATYVVQET